MIQMCKQYIYKTIAIHKIIIQMAFKILLTHIIFVVYIDSK
jgi:hypothetical protein